jgi:two-component system sporulation sensor kinase A
VLALKLEGQLLAVFFLFAGPHGAMSYLRAEQVRDILRRVASAIGLARSHEDKRRMLGLLGPVGLIGAMASSMEHQLRGPARRMRMDVSELKKGECTPAEVARLHDKLGEEVESLNQATGKLIDFARAPSSEFGPVCLVEAIEKAWQDLSDQRRSEEVATFPRIELPAKSDLCVEGLREFLVLSFKFVLQNAVQAIERKRFSAGHAGEITVQLEDGPARVTVRITDNGVGMDDVQRRQAFNPFFSGTSLGTGLGLTAAVAILYAQHGDMKLESRLMEGTTVTIFLPKRR